MNSAPTALLVEDCLDDAFFFRRALKKGITDCALQHVLDGQSAIDYLRESQARRTLPEIVFLDLKMPGMNGFEVLEWLRDHQLNASMVVVVLSGSNQDCDKERARELGAAGYIVKPVLPEQIAAWFDALSHPAAPRPDHALAQE